MQEIDKYFTEHPTTGRQGMIDHLKMIGYTVNIKRVSRLMDKIGLEAIYPKKMPKQRAIKILSFLLQSSTIPCSR